MDIGHGDKTRYGCCWVLSTVFLPALHRKGPFVLCPAPNSRRIPARPQLSLGWASPVRDCARHRRTSQCTGQPERPEIQTLKGRVLCTRLGSLPLITSQYSIESSALMIFHGHWDWGLGPFSRSSPPRHSLSLPCRPFVVPVPHLPIAAPSYPVPLCRENAVKLPIGGSTSRVRDETAQNTPEPTPPSLVILSSQEFPALSAACTTHSPSGICRYWLIISPTWPVASAPGLYSLVPPSEKYPSDAIVLHSNTPANHSHLPIHRPLFVLLAQPLPVCPSARLIRVTSCS